MNKQILNIDNFKMTLYSENNVFDNYQHESTVSMLEIMNKCDFSNKRVLDLGTGTGILSIYAALNNASEIIAIDNDINAVEIAEKNMNMNNVNDIVKVQ